MHPHLAGGRRAAGVHQLIAMWPSSWCLAMVHVQPIQHAAVSLKHFDLTNEQPLPVLIAPQEAAARKRQRQEQEAYRLAMADPASWAARLNISFADYAHDGAVVCM